MDKKHDTFVDHKSFARQPTIAQCVGAQVQTQTKLGFHSTKTMEITTAIGEHVILDMKPLSSVESKLFRNILARLSQGSLFLAGHIIKTHLSQSYMKPQN